MVFFTIVEGLVVQVSKIYREVNQAADSVANWVLIQSLGFHYLFNPPKFLAKFPDADTRDTGCPRACPYFVF